MRRDDLSEADRRELDTQRSRVCRAVGQAHSRMIDAGHDPSEDMEWMMRWLMHRVKVVEAHSGDFREAA